MAAFLCECRCRYTSKPAAAFAPAGCLCGQPGNPGLASLLLAGEASLPCAELFSWFDLGSTAQHLYKNPLIAQSCSTPQAGWQGEMPQLPASCCTHPAASGLFAPQMWPLLRDAPWQRMLLAALIAALFYLHYRCHGSCPASHMPAAVLQVEQHPAALRRGLLSPLPAAWQHKPSAVPTFHVSGYRSCSCLCRTFKLDPGYLEARGFPQPMTPAQRMMLAAQVRCGWRPPCGAMPTPLRLPDCRMHLALQPGAIALDGDTPHTAASNRIEPFRDVRRLPDPVCCCALLSHHPVCCFACLPCRTPLGATPATSTSPFAQSTAATATGGRAGSKAGSKADSKAGRRVAEAPPQRRWQPPG